MIVRTYRLSCPHVHTGGLVQGDLVDGTNVYARDARLRLRGIIADSMTTISGRLARNQLALLLSKAKHVTATVYKDDGYHMDAVIHADGLCINDWMVENLYTKTGRGQ